MILIVSQTDFIDKIDFFVTFFFFFFLFFSVPHILCVALLRVSPRFRRKKRLCFPTSCCSLCLYGFFCTADMGFCGAKNTQT